MFYEFLGLTIHPMDSLVISILILLGLCQLVLWLVFEVDTRRRGISAARYLTPVGLVPFIGLGIFLWYLLDRESFVEYVTAFDPEQ